MYFKYCNFFINWYDLHSSVLYGYLFIYFWSCLCTKSEHICILYDALTHVELILSGKQLQLNRKRWAEWKGVPKKYLMLITVFSTLIMIWLRHEFGLLEFSSWNQSILMYLNLTFLFSAFQNEANNNQKQTNKNPKL